MENANVPMVVCVMLADGRRDMVQRAIRCFEAQNYDKARRRLLIYDTSEEPLRGVVRGNLLVHRYEVPKNGRNIGQLRNAANELAVVNMGAEVIAHWDSDDWSGRDRLTDQIMLLHSTGAELVGYNQMLFWDTRPGAFCGAWIYTGRHPQCCIGTSFCYPVSTWQKRKFKPVPEAEDLQFTMGLKVSVVSAGVHDPRMVATVHGANTTCKIMPGYKEWSRYAGADAFCREALALQEGVEA